MRVIFDEAQSEDCTAHIVELLDRLRDEERALRRQVAEAARARGYPSTSSFVGAGGASNRLHNFGTDAAPDWQCVPQQTDPVGELVANQRDDEAELALA